MKFIRRIIIAIFSIHMLCMIPASFAQDKFSEALEKSTTKGGQTANPVLDWTNAYTQGGLEGTKLFIYDIVYKFVFPILMIVSVFVVIIGLYRIMFSGKDEIEKGFNYILYGAVGIIIIQSARFITSSYINIVNRVAPDDTAQGALTFTQAAYELYNTMFMPFVDIFMYIILGMLFVLLLVHVIRFITSSEEDVVSKAKTIVISNIVGIVVILLSKTMVEAIYGKQATVVSANTSTSISDVGTGLLDNADLTPIFTIINYVLGFLGIIILIIIIIQTYQLLVNPTSDELIKKIKKNMTYILAGLAIIAGAYVIVNFIIIG